MPGGTTRRRSKNAAAAAAPAGAKRKLDNEAEARTRALYRWNTAQLHFELEQAYELRCAFARALETAQWADALPDPLRSALDATRSALNAVCGAECTRRSLWPPASTTCSAAPLSTRPQASQSPVSVEPKRSRGGVKHRPKTGVPKPPSHAPKGASNANRAGQSARAPADETGAVTLFAPDKPAPNGARLF